MLYAKLSASAQNPTRNDAGVRWVVLLGAVLFFCCSTPHAHAAQRERVIAVLNAGVVQLEKSGKAMFQNTLALDAAMVEAWLSAHALQREISVTMGDDDRYGRRTITSDVQENMLRDGVVILYATQGEIPANWRMAEAAARAAKRGLWARDSLIITPQKTGSITSGFYAVEGTITRIYEGKTATSINFGNDWRKDFSVTISPKLRRSMKAFLTNLNAGDHVRVRGSIVEENGPMIRLNHADNVEKI